MHPVLKDLTTSGVDDSFVEIDNERQLLAPPQAARVSRGTALRVLQSMYAITERSYNRGGMQLKTPLIICQRDERIFTSILQSLPEAQHTRKRMKLNDANLDRDTQEGCGGRLSVVEDGN